jgi:hypothetical protein
MNTKNQKIVLEGFKNRIDLLGSRTAALQSLTGEELANVIQALADALNALNPPQLTYDEENYKHSHGDSLKSMLADEAALNSQPSTLNR